MSKSVVITITIILTLFISGAGMFYWFGLRPSEIKKACSQYSLDRFEADINTIGDEWNEKILKDTGYSWNEIFECREKNFPLISEDKKTDKQKRCEKVLYGNSDENFYWYPVHVAGRYDESRNKEISAVKKKRDETIDRYYKECLRSKGL